MRTIVLKASFLTVLLLPAIFLAQTAPASGDSANAAGAGNSLGAAAARNAKAQKPAPTQTKRVFTNDDMEPSDEPLPRLNMDGAENTAHVVDAIARYSETHSAKQTDDAVREWYDLYDQALASAIQENIDGKQWRDARSRSHQSCLQEHDADQCQSQRLAGEGAAPNPRVDVWKNDRVIVRIQQGFTRVRKGMLQHKLRYDWFKVRASNGNDTY